MLSLDHALDVSEEVVVGTSEVKGVADAQEKTSYELLCITQLQTIVTE